jgi:hypothetical protein
MTGATWEWMVQAHREGIVAREHLCSFRYKREHPVCFRLRRQAARALWRWDRKRAYVRDSWYHLINPLSYFNHDASIFPSRVARILLAPFAFPIALVVVAAFWASFAMVWIWRRPPLLFLEWHYQRECARACQGLDAESPQRSNRALGAGISDAASRSVRQRIHEILADRRLDDEMSELTKAEAIEGLIAECGWQPVCDCMLEVLRDDEQRAHWRVAADLFWGATLDGRPLPADELIAWLYHRFDPKGDAEDNLVWSITSNLKRVGYLSGYQPLRDPDVLRHLRRIRGDMERDGAG